MKRLDKRFLWVSLGIHVFVLFLLFFFYPSNNVHKKFLVYGVHSKHKTQAFFKMLRAPSGAKFVQARRQLEQRRLEMRRKTIAEKQKVQKLAVQKAKALADQKAKALEERKRLEAIKKTEIENKKLAERTEPKKNPVPAKKPEPKKLVQNKIPEKKIEKKQEPKSEPEIKPTALSKVEGAGQSGVDDEEQLHFNVLGETDRMFIRFQGYVQQEIERVWQPPLGVPKGTECTGLFKIGKDGSVQKFELLTRSKILIYDLSIIKVSRNFKFDSCLWGKTFSVDFRQ